MSNSAALLGGPDYTPYEINKRRDHTLERLVIETYRGLISKLEQNDYSVNVMNPTLVECDALAEVGDCGDTLSYRDILYNKYDYDMVSAFDKRLLFMLSAFKALPLSLKSTLYQSEYWTNVFDTPPMTAQSERYYEHLFVQSLPRFSEVATGRDENRFVHLWLDGLVAPFFLDASCEIADRSWEMWGMAARRDSANCMFTGLGQWFAWMKENGVYDNTKIIIVADHGAGEFGETWYQNAATPALMVKDFDRHDPIERSDMLMSNSDVLSIICGALDSGCDDVPADPTKSPAQDRVLTFSITTHGDADFFRNSKAFDIVRYYEISGSVHDRDGWVEKEPTK
jgi:hypothetical protein